MHAKKHTRLHGQVTSNFALLYLVATLPGTETQFVKQSHVLLQPSFENPKAEG